MKTGKLQPSQVPRPTLRQSGNLTRWIRFKQICRFTQSDLLYPCHPSPQSKPSIWGPCCENCKFGSNFHFRFWKEFCSTKMNKVLLQLFGSVRVGVTIATHGNWSGCCCAREEGYGGIRVTCPYTSNWSGRVRWDKKRHGQPGAWCRRWRGCVALAPGFSVCPTGLTSNTSQNEDSWRQTFLEGGNSSERGHQWCVTVNTAEFGQSDKCLTSSGNVAKR